MRHAALMLFGGGGAAGIFSDDQVKTQLPGVRRQVMTEEVVEQCRRMLENGATRQQVADVIGVDVKTIYKYLPAT